MPSSKTTKKKSKNQSQSKLRLFANSRYGIIAVVFVVLFGAIGVWRLDASHAASYPCSNEISAGTVLEYGSSGSCVVYLQEMLNGIRAYAAVAGPGSGRAEYHGNSTHLTPDGDFGPLTEASVKAYQAWQGLSVDGVVGRATWGSVCGNTAGGLGQGDYDWMTIAYAVYPGDAVPASNANGIACSAYYDGR
jgi:hypothetical protein